MIPSHNYSSSDEMHEDYFVYKLRLELQPFALSDKSFTLREVLLGSS